MSVQIGRAGVFLTCSRLESLGVQSTIADAQGFDIVTFVPEICRIEVKATSRKPNGGNKLEFNASKGGLKQIVTPEHCDIIAFASLHFGVVLFQHVTELKRKMMKISASYFSLEHEAKSWAEAVSRIAH